MLKNFGYDGVYHDPNVTVGALLENPIDYGIDAGTLVFSITIRDKRRKVTNLTIEDFSFYIMDEQGRLYNTQTMPYLQPKDEAEIEGDESVRNPDGLIFTEFRHEFLFQDLRIAFRYGSCQRLYIIELGH